MAKSGHSSHVIIKQKPYMTDWPFPPSLCPRMRDPSIVPFSPHVPMILESSIVRLTTTEVSEVVDVLAVVEAL